MASAISSQSVTFDELMVAARTPARPAASTWLRINASSGETISAGPAPARRCSSAAMK